MRFQGDSEEDYSLQLTSLIDVVFLLLIFFMVSTSFVDFTRSSTSNCLKPNRAPRWWRKNRFSSRSAWRSESP